MSDTYLQDFGTRRSIHRARPKVDPMAASGRWDDLYLRASKPRLRKTVRRDSMRKDTTLYLTRKVREYTTVNGKKTWKLVVKRSQAYPFMQDSASGKALGFTCDQTAYKYKLDTPSYPARHRELALEKRSTPPTKRLGVIGLMPVYKGMRRMIHKMRFGNPLFTRKIVEDFRTMWPIRHQLRKMVDEAHKNELTLPAVFTSEYVPPAPQPPTPVVVRKPAKPSKPRKVSKAIYKEYEKIKRLLVAINKVELTSHESWDKKIKADRQEALRRQAQLLSIIESGK